MIGWWSTGGGNNRAFRRLCEEPGRPELADERRFRDNRDRVINRDDLTEELERLLMDVDGHGLCERLLGADLPAGPVLNTDQVMHHPHALHREMSVAERVPSSLPRC